MTEPTQGAEPQAREQVAAPDPEIVQWGSPEQPSRLRRLLADPAWGSGQGWRDPRVAWVLAALGGLVLFGSMIDTWQVTSLPNGFFEAGQQEVTHDLATVGSWGAAWMVAVTALAAGTGLAVFGPARLRQAARAIGFAIAGAQVGLLVAMTISLAGRSELEVLVPGMEMELVPTIGRGVYLAYLGLLLVAAALWWTRPAAGTTPAEPAGSPLVAAYPAAPAAPADPAPVGAPRQPGPAPGWPALDHAGPADLQVGPAEPFTRLGPAPDDDERWRRPGAGGG